MLLANLDQIEPEVVEARNVRQFPAGWLDSAKDWSAEGAREVIQDDGVAMSNGVNLQGSVKKLGWQ